MTRTRKIPRVISMVPSWTEMLLSIGLDTHIDVIGRTRFCIEPSTKVKQIPIVGGTKDWDLKLIESMAPDLIILDKDENPKSMIEGHKIPFIATHVQNIRSCIDGIQLIASAITALNPTTKENFDAVITRWNQIANKCPIKQHSWQTLPGLIEWVKQPTTEIKDIYYIIWKNPWMAATKETFIGDLAKMVGLPLSNTAATHQKHYPEIDLTTLDPNHTLLLFSSEPYPFHKKTEELKSLPFPSAIVDGQSFSWFGVRSLTFLEKIV